MGRNGIARLLVCSAVIGALAMPGTAGAAPAPTRVITEFGCPADTPSPFGDIAGSTHETAIECLAALGLVSGTTTTTFAPAVPVTRGQLATIMARAVAGAGVPLDAADAGFTDLGGTVHTDAINALANLGIISGKTATTFGPDDRATRAQTASILARSIPPEVFPSAPADAFTDDEGAAAHEAAINRLAAVGILSGVGGDRFDPDAPVTRGAVASFIARALDLLVEVGIIGPPFETGSLSAALRPSEEVPGPGQTGAAGTVGILRGGLPGLLCVQWDIDGPFTAAPTAAHIHTGAAGTAGPVLLTLPTPQVAAGQRLFSQGCVSGLDQAAIDAVFANPAGHYVNVHTPSFPDGAIRGQLARLATPTSTVLTGAEEAPGPGEAGAGGEAFVDVQSDGRTICTFVLYDGNETPTAAHIHEAAAGSPGPVVVTLPPFDADGAVADGCVGGLNEALVSSIAANPGNFYVNVHTNGHPDGAVRGQLQLSAFFGADLVGSEEVPGPGDADGSGSAFVDVVGDGRMCVSLDARGLDRVVAAHIHRGAAGVAGPIVVELAAPVFGFAQRCVDVAPALAAEIVANPAAFYVNVHTQAFPAGAIRGQLGPDDL